MAVGYDTIWLQCDVHPAEANIVAGLLDKEGCNKITGEVWSVGNVGNLRVCAGGSSVTIKGSAAAFLLPDNVVTLNRKQMGEAVFKMSDTLHIDVSKAKPTRIDVSASLPMKNAPSAYYSSLGNLTYFKRSEVAKETLYYLRGGKNPQTLAFYDKCRECYDKQSHMPKVFKDIGNVLRYEYRINGRVSSQMHWGDLTAATLTDEDFFRSIVNKWRQNYEHIKKTYYCNDMSGIRTVKDGMDFIFGFALSAIGADAANGLIDEMKQGGVYEDRNSIYRLRRKVTEVSSKFKGEVENDLTIELDNAIREAAASV